MLFFVFFARLLKIELLKVAVPVFQIQKRKSAPLSPVAVKRLKVAEERKPNIMNRKSLLGQLNFH